MKRLVTLVQTIDIHSSANFETCLTSAGLQSGLNPVSTQWMEDRLHKGHVAMLSITSNTCKGCEKMCMAGRAVYSAVHF